MGDMTMTCADPTRPSASVTLHPEWAVAEQSATEAAWHRTRTGALATARWARYAEFRVPLRWVPATDAALLNAWWQAGVTVAFTLDPSAQRATVLCGIANATLPLAERMAPDGTARAGVLILRARYAGGRTGRPFILDHPAQGRLDDAALTLVP